MRKIINPIIPFILLLLVLCNKNPVIPEEQFIKIHFHYGFGNELNTFEQTYQKDLVLDGSVKIPFWLTAEEQEQIISKVQTVNFFQFPDTICYNSETDSFTVAIVEPNPGRQFLRILYQEQDKTVNWYLPLPDNEYSISLLELIEHIISIIESKPEYQSLPPVRGGYI